MGSHQPPLQERDDSVHVGQEIALALPTSREDRDRVFVPHRFEPVVPCPPVGSYPAASFHRIMDEGAQTGSRSVANPSQPNPSDSLLDLFRRHGDQRLPAGRRPARTPLFQTSQIGFVHFHQALQAFPTRTNHGPPEFVQPRPRRPVTPQAQDPLDSQRTGTIFLAGHVPHGSKPQRQRKTAVLKDRPGRDRGLAPTSAAQPEPPAHHPSFLASAAGAYEAVRPAKSTQIRATSLVRAEACFEVHQGVRVVLHAATHYGLREVESSTYPSRNKQAVYPNVGSCRARSVPRLWINVSVAPVPAVMPGHESRLVGAVYRAGREAVAEGAEAVVRFMTRAASSIRQ
jgi:hypothetical protein